MRQVSQRTAAIVGGLILIAAIAIAVVLVSGGSDSNSAPEQVQLQGITSPLTAPDAGTAQADQPNGKAAPVAKPAAPAPAPSVAPSSSVCTPEMTREQCQQLTRVINDARSGSHVVDPNKCNLPTRELCEAAGKAYQEAQKGSHVVGENECSLTQEQCEEAGRQMQESGANPFN